MGWAGALLLLALAGSAWGQQPADAPNAMLLIATPQLRDPNFRQTVVLVTQSRDFNTVGVILNRPTQARHRPSGKPLGFGGPVLREVTVALFRSPKVPQAAAFHVLRGVYLTMHPENLERLLTPPASERHRLFSGFSGWAPRQLEAELERGSWIMLPATEELLFREDTAEMWKELFERAQRGKVPRVRAPQPKIYWPA